MKMAFYFLLVKTEQVNHKGRALGWTGERCKNQEPGGVWVDDHSFVLLFKKTAFPVSRGHKHSWSCPEPGKSVFLLIWFWVCLVFGFCLFGLFCFVVFVFVLFCHLLAIWFGQLTFFRLFGHVLSLFFKKKWKNEVREAVKYTLYLFSTLKRKHRNMNNKSELFIISNRMSISRIHETPSFPELQLPVSHNKRVSHFLVR